MREATLKDVLYGLQFGKAELCRWPSHKVGGRTAWSLEPGGLKVSQATADKARDTPGVKALDHTRHGEARYGWAS